MKNCWNNTYFFHNQEPKFLRGKSIVLSGVQIKAINKKLNPSTKNRGIFYYMGVFQLVRSPTLEVGRCRFKSCYPYKIGIDGKWVKSAVCKTVIFGLCRFKSYLCHNIGSQQNWLMHLTVNQGIIGSSPILPAIQTFSVMVSTKHFDCFSSGSNPLMSAKLAPIAQWLVQCPFKAETWVQFPMGVQIGNMTEVVNVPD